MKQKEPELSRACVDMMHADNEQEQRQAMVDACKMSVNDVIQLLAHYQYVSDSDKDELIDPWLDSLSAEQKKILQAFEIARGRIEQSH